jgi:omega-amidase
MKTALIQMDISLGEVEKNRNRAELLIARGIAQGAELFILPELWTTGYQLKEIAKLAEPENGQTVSMLRRIAKENRIEIIAGSIAELRDGKVFNTAYAVGREGQILAKYSKIHLIGLMEEDCYLKPGHEKCLFDMRIGKAGMIICYDLRFTELPRTMALQGCHTLFVVAEWPSVRGTHWKALNIARAIENQMFVVAVNRVGQDEENVFYGHSLVIDPWGEILIEGSETKEELLVVNIDFDAVGAIRKRVPVFADRRPDCYE